MTTFFPLFGLGTDRANCAARRARGVLSPLGPAARLAVFGAVFFIASAWGAQEQQAAPAPPAKDSKPAEFVGSETCQACHEDIFNAFQKNPHHLVETDKKRGWETKACESCHGPGSKHAESMNAADIQNPAKLRPAETDKVCLTCHLNQPTHVGRINSSHAKNQVSCVACHSIHKNGPNGLVERKAAGVNQLCAKCHADVWASFQRPYRHRLPEGAMACVDCHNPHGSLLPRSIQTANANEPGCFKCHGDKRGPFVFEHAPMRLEGCAACHEPHGSANPRMLTRHEVRFLCLECHSNVPGPKLPANGTLATAPPGFHDLREPRFQNCNLCHQKVHGSYVDRGLTR
ncbi:MAG TPA: DmsE family decaheme c-type cytochrome [Bryobacteraceae bacterium]|nr:DmsE family decaheme c-type cytochrome [Bryobacteraceae bacterium]